MKLLGLWKHTGKFKRKFTIEMFKLNCCNFVARRFIDVVSAVQFLISYHIPNKLSHVNKLASRLKFDGDFWSFYEILIQECPPY